MSGRYRRGSSERDWTMVLRECAAAAGQSRRICPIFPRRLSLACEIRRFGLTGNYFTIYDHPGAVADYNVLDVTRNKVLVLASQSKSTGPAVESLRSCCDVVEIGSIDQAIEALRHDQFDAIFSDSADFLPLERALVSQQANLILNTIGEGVCIVDGEGRCNWMNKKMQAWPAARTREDPPHVPGGLPAVQQAGLPADRRHPRRFNRSKRYALNIEDQQFLEMIAIPVINPAGQVVQVVAVVWDATGTRRLQQKIDAIDKAGRELVRLEADVAEQDERRPAPEAAGRQDHQLHARPDALRPLRDPRCSTGRTQQAGDGDQRRACRARR